MKRPAFQFYPGDWRKDVELRSCSLAARGLWMDLLCIAHECEPYGYLTLNGKPMTPAQMAGQIGGVTGAQVAKLLAELIDNGVARKTDSGVVYSKRMVDDERVRNARAGGGSAGAEYGHLGAEHGQRGGSSGAKGGRPKGSKGAKNPPLTEPINPPLEEADNPPLEGEITPPPSSSSSASAYSEANASAADAARATPMTAKERLWAVGIAMLGERGRTHLGKLVGTYGEDAVAEAVDACAVEQPGDPRAWLTAACAARARAKPQAPAGQGDLLADPRPDWALQAGFANRFEAENEGCTPRNFREFANGRRVAA